MRLPPALLAFGLLLALLALPLPGGGVAAASGACAAAIPDPGDEDCDGYRTDRAPFDNCPRIANPSQANTDAGYTPTSPAAADGGGGMQDGDDLGDACDGDDDADGVADRAVDGSRLDTCPLVRNPGQSSDACPPRDGPDGDGVSTDVDNCPNSTNPDQANADGDDQGDACDGDDDNDLAPDGRDNCPFVANQEQGDRDGNGRGTACDPEELRGGDGAGGAPGAPPADGAGPEVTPGAPGRWRLGDLRGGLPTAVRCSEACGLDARLELRSADRRRLRLRSPVVATAAAQLASAGRTYLFFTARRGVTARLRRMPARGIRLTIRITAVDAAGERTSITRRVRLMR